MNVSEIVGNFSQNATIFSNTSQFYPYLNQGELWANVVISAILSLIGFIENFVVIRFLVLGEHFLGVPSNVFLLSLVMTEMLFCAIAGPLLVISLVHESLFEYLVSASRFLVLVTVASIFLMSLNRLVSVKYSMKYQVVMTTRRATSLVAFAWSLGLGLLVLAAVSYDTGIVLLRRQLLRYFIVLFTAMIIAINCYLYAKSRQHRCAITAQLSALQQAIVKKNDFIAVKTILLVTGTFFITWIPIAVAAMTTQRFIDPELYFKAFFRTAPLALLNAVLDPVIYYFRTDEFKRCYQRRKRRLFPSLEQAPISHIKILAAVISNRIDPIT